MMSWVTGDSLVYGVVRCFARTERHPPFIPAQAGIQVPLAQTPQSLLWVPASAGTNGECVASLSASQIARCEIGSALTSTPSGASASFTALATAAGAPR